MNIALSLAAAVPLHVLELRRRGGPSDDDLAECGEISRLVAERGDLMLFGGGSRGVVAQLFNRLAFGMAVLSFAPGGVRCFGMTFDSSGGEK